MPTVVTSRLIIVCTEAARTKMNGTLNAIDPTSTGDVMTAQVARTADPATTVGRWTSWGMPENHKQAIIAAFAGTGWSPLKGSEGKILALGAPVPAWGTQRFWLFDGATGSWTPQAVLNSLGLIRTAIVEE